jgi:hypothetical protein
MQPPKGYFSITILTKAYLKNYLQTRYGNPLIFNKGNDFGMLVAAYMERPLKFGVTAEELHQRFDLYTVPLEIFLPNHLRDQRRPIAVNDQNTLSLNRLFESHFCEKLFDWVSYGIIYQVELKKNIQEFCWRHKISIGNDYDDDISIDAIIRKERRYRRKKEQHQAKLRVGLNC